MQICNNLASSRRLKILPLTMISNLSDEELKAGKKMSTFQ
jgi:hypothetical protein